MSDDVINIHNVLHTDGSAMSLAAMLHDLMRDICLKTGKSAAEGTSLLMLAAVMIYHDHARHPEDTPEGIASVAKTVAKVYLKEIEGMKH